MRKIKQAIILSAGMGSRMLELTENIPKPMLVVDGISLIERHLIYLHKNDIKKIVINTYYKADILENFVKSLDIYKKLEIHFSREEELLGTAGGVKNALKFLEKDPFFIINSDAIYIDHNSSNPSFLQMEESWSSNKMHILILVLQKELTFGYNGKGDFNINKNNQLSNNQDNRELVHIGMTVTDYRIFENYSQKILEFPKVYQDIMSLGKLYGCLYKGNWLHIGDKKAFIDAKAIGTIS